MATILQIANADKNLGNFSRALKLSGLEEQLNEVGPFTLLGPINLAFGNLHGPSMEQLFLPANKQKLVDLLSCHILMGKKMLSDFMPGRKLKTIDGREVSITLVGGEILINDAKILARDRQGRNGVVHSINMVCTIAEVVS